jgi:hypothetical protein
MAGLVSVFTDIIGPVLLIGTSGYALGRTRIAETRTLSSLSVAAAEVCEERLRGQIESGVGPRGLETGAAAGDRPRVRFRSRVAGISGARCPEPRGRACYRR